MCQSRLSKVLVSDSKRFGATNIRFSSLNYRAEFTYVLQSTTKEDQNNSQQAQKRLQILRRILNLIHNFSRDFGSRVL